MAETGSNGLNSPGRAAPSHARHHGVPGSGRRPRLVPPGAALLEKLVVPPAGPERRADGSGEDAVLVRLHLQPEPNARYETVDQVLAVTKQAHVEKMGFVGNEAYANF